MNKPRTWTAETIAIGSELLLEGASTPIRSSSPNNWRAAGLHPVQDDGR